MNFSGGGIGWNVSVETKQWRVKPSTSTSGEPFTRTSHAISMRTPRCARHQAVTSSRSS